MLAGVMNDKQLVFIIPVKMNAKRAYRIAGVSQAEVPVYICGSAFVFSVISILAHGHTRHLGLELDALPPEVFEHIMQASFSVPVVLIEFSSH